MYVFQEIDLQKVNILLTLFDNIFNRAKVYVITILVIFTKGIGRMTPDTAMEPCGLPME